MSFIIPEWLVLVQAVVAAIVGGMALVAWKKERLTNLKRAAHHRAMRLEQNKRRRAADRRRAEMLRHKRSTARAHRGSLPARQKTQTQPRSRTARGAKASTTETSAKLSLGNSRKRKKVTLAGRMVEHRCPYCLEPVAQNDPRGVKICSVCGAWHHQDCWDITGHCQVPHRGNGA